MTDETKRRLRARFAQLLHETDQKPQTTLDDLEDLLLHLRDQVTNAAREEVNRELLQEPQPAYEQENETEQAPQKGNSSSPVSKVPCPFCGKSNAWYKGKRLRQVVTLAGPLTLVRAYYHCRRCQRGVCPEDSRRHLPQGTNFSTRVAQEVACLSACLPFAQAVKTLARFCPVTVSAASAERLSRTQLAALTDAFVQEREEQYLPLAFASAQTVASLTPSLPRPTVLYLAADGIQTPMQGGSWREMKIGVVQSRFADGRIDKASRYVNVLGDSETFGAKWEALAISCGSLCARTVVVLGDGAPWLWNLAQKRFPRAVQILDFWHALEYVGKVAREVFGEGTPAGKLWLSARAAEMKKSDWRAFHAALESVRSRAEDAVTDVVRYFANNASRMNYATYLKRGLSIGSGIAESSCKRLVTQRLKGSGMHWSQQGTQAVCSLRCLLLGGLENEFLDFWKRQVQQTQINGRVQNAKRAHYAPLS